MASAGDLIRDGEGGECGALLRELDGAATPLGPADTWPLSLRFAVRTVLSSRYPMLLLWGASFTQIYNDAYAELIGDKHPSALGGDVRITLAEGWDVLGPLIDEAMETGVASWVPALQLLLARSGYREEAYFSVSHAPARDDDGRTVGVLTVCSEVTTQVLSERRLSVLRDLSLRSGSVLDVESGLGALRETLTGQGLDVPFAALYLRDGQELERALLVSEPADAAAVAASLPVRVAPGQDDPWGLLAPDGVRDVPAALRVAGGPWGDPVRTALTISLTSSSDLHAPLGVLVVAVSPARALDEGYTSFFSVLGQQVAATLRTAQAYEEERRRAEALAELDRAKTQFFTNVSHEFRTPLTLMLGPLADALEDPSLPPVHAERVGLAHRNAQRLLRLVNDLLSLSALEAGRSTVDARALDLAAATTEHASAFRAAVERAGLELVVDCPPLPRPVRMDPGHWETVVTNLLSNALKFTFVGRIAVTLRADADEVVLTVADTGVGVPEAERDRLFERFSRVSGTRARSHEGSGIGLALVAELARLHGGDVLVDSAVGEGTAFRVRLPWTAVRPAPDAVADPAATSSTVPATAAEALAWTEAEAPSAPTVRQADPELVGARVLVADDNRDMRAYLVRLLQDAGCVVTAVGDGAAALQALRSGATDLLLTDVMMPHVDGFELLQAVRRDEALQALPVVVLSARAGSEAGIEGLDLGADDYLVKPFRADELLARLRSTLRLARTRSAHAAQLRAVAETTAVLSGGRPLEDAVREVLEQTRALLGAGRLRAVLRDRAGRPLADVVSPPSAGTSDAEQAHAVEVDGTSYGTLEVWGELTADAGPLLAPLLTVLAALASTAGEAERDREIAVALQRSLLPQRLPDVDGLELSAGYLPASGELQVGGDWYDVHALPDGRVVVAVGDAAGHGLPAATAMGQLRDAVRAYALEDPDPARTLARVDALTAALGTTAFATVWLGVLEPSSGTLTWCSAGHVAPALLLPGAAPGWLTGPTAPAIGAGSGAAYVDSSTVLPEDACLVLYTDGLVEDRDTQLEDGPDQLLGRLSAAPPTAGALVDAALRPGALEHADDIAVLVLRRCPPAAPVVLRAVDEVRTYPAELRSAALARRDLRRVLEDAGVPEDDAFALLLAVSEAFNNAVEHAQSPSRLEVQVRVVVDGRSCRVLVRDYGVWRERPPAMDRGRGAALMQAAGAVHVVPSAEGTTLTIERQWS